MIHQLNCDVTTFSNPALDKPTPHRRLPVPHCGQDYRSTFSLLMREAKDQKSCFDCGNFKSLSHSIGKFGAAPAMLRLSRSIAAYPPRLVGAFRAVAGSRMADGGPEAALAYKRPDQRCTAPSFCRRAHSYPRLMALLSPLSVSPNAGCSLASQRLPRQTDWAIPFLECAPACAFLQDLFMLESLSGSGLIPRCDTQVQPDLPTATKPHLHTASPPWEQGLSPLTVGGD